LKDLGDFRAFCAKTAGAGEEAIKKKQEMKKQEIEPPFPFDRNGSICEKRPA
jgi:hypothetical protein